MTVGELKRQLDRFEDSRKVACAFDVGNYSHTTGLRQPKAVEVQAAVFGGSICGPDGLALRREDDRLDDEPDPYESMGEFVVLS